MMIPTIHWAKHQKFFQILIFFAIWQVLGTTFIQAQSPSSTDDLAQTVRSDAKTLSSAEMFGRGYQNDGHLLAARFIAQRFESIGLEPVPQKEGVESPYFQPFRISLNLVEGPQVLSLNNKTLTIGEEYIINARSKRADFYNSKVKDLGFGMPEKFNKSLKGYVVIFRSGLPEKIANDPVLKKKYASVAGDDVKIDFATKMQAEAVIIIKNKLTASLSNMPADIPIIEVLETAIPKKKIKKCSMKIETGVRSITSQNVVGMVRGSTFPDSVVIVSAHYDHLGRQGEAIFYGGNDNASGTATLISLASYFAKPENKPKCTMLFVAFSGEEAGLLGSRHYVERDPLIPLANTKFILNLDLMANGDEGITAVAGLDYPTDFEQLQAINTKLNAVPQVKGRGNAPNSDHYFFVKNGVKGMFIYTLGGPPHYHDVNDTYEAMVFPKINELQKLLSEFLKWEMN